jgi:hypothetical protein
VTETVVDALAISVADGTEIKDESFAGTPHSMNLLVDLDGDASAITGRTLYVVVEMPDAGLYQPPGASIGGGYLSVTLTGNPEGWSKEGHYTGTMDIYACLDPECKSQLANSPVAVPYDIRVKPPLKLSATSLDLRSTFGTAAPAGQVTVSLPEGATDWNIIGGANIASKQGNLLLLRPPTFAPAGTYIQQVVVETAAVPADGDWTRRTIMQETLTVDYSVASSAVPYVMVPASASYFIALNDAAQRAGEAQVIWQDGTLSLRGVRLGSHPVAADGNPSLSTWLQVTYPHVTSYSVSPCGMNPNDLSCLPAGSYEGAVQLRHTSAAGVITDFEFPVSMTIAP